MVTEADIERILRKFQERIRIEEIDKIFGSGRELTSSDLGIPSDPEPYTRRHLIEPILASLGLEVERDELKFRGINEKDIRKVDYWVKNQRNDDILIEAKPLNADLFKLSKDGGVNQIKGVFRLREVSQKYEFGAATDGLKWVFVDKTAEVANPDKPLDIIQDFDTILEYLSGEEKVAAYQFEEQISKKFYGWYNALLHGGAYKDHENKSKSIPLSYCFVENIASVPLAEDREAIAQTVMDRLIFIKFLQSKQIITFDVLEYLLTLGEDLVNDKLKNFFFRILNTPTEDRFDIDPKFSKIPYLNGSLFVKTDAETRNSDYRIRASILREVIKFLDSFQFVHKEGVSGERVLDPQILGYIFERAMTALDRKGSGAYYTPKMITRFIAENTIYPIILHRINNLLREKDYPDADLLTDIDQIYTLREPTLQDVYSDILPELKICDNACGSGAFLLAAADVLLDIYVKIAQELRLVFDYSEIALRKVILRNNLHGVDINPNAVEIAKLRLWLWLVTAYRPNLIEPLPNIDYNIRVGNSLIGFADISPFISSERTLDAFDLDESLYATLKWRDEKIADYERSQGKKARELKIQIDDVSDKIRNILNAKILDGSEGLTEQDLMRINPLHWAIEFSRVFRKNGEGGFDSIISNPPYIKEDVRREVFEDVKKANTPVSRLYEGKMDYWHFFVGNALDIIKVDGHVGYIALSNWVTNDGSSKLRREILKNTQLRKFVDFNEFKIFEDAGNQTMVMLLERGTPANAYHVDYAKIEDKDISRQDVATFLANQNISEGIEAFDAILSPFDVEDKIYFISSTHKPILDAMASRANFHLRENEVFSGIDILQDFVSKRHIQTLGTNFRVGQGIFVLSKEEYDAFRPSLEERKLLKPYYTTNELNRYFANAKNQYYIIYSTAEVWKNIKQYPKVKEHLDKFAAVNTSVNKPYGLHRPRDENNFKGNKILSVRKTPHPKFTYVDFDCYVSRMFNIIKTQRADLTYLLIIFNSALVDFWLRDKGKKQGNMLQMDQEPLMNIPVRILPEYEHVLTRLGDYLLALHEENGQEQSNRRKEAIAFLDAGLVDGIIYELYFKDELNTNLEELLEPYLQEPSKDLEGIIQTVCTIKSKADILDELAKIKSHNWIQIINRTIDKFMA